MTEFFLTILNMSISASWIVLAVLLLRLVLKKAPKWITVLLWGIVAVRLICPFSIESALSLIPSAETISPQVMVETPEINTGFFFINATINPIIQDSTVTFAPEKSVNTMKLLVQCSSLVWGIGVGVMFVYTAISYWRVKRKIGAAVLLRDNIFQSENVVSPFVLGIIKPKLYLPFQINEQDMTHVIAHENAHIRRKDHWWKPFGFLLLSIHWFNPLMWLGYILLCRDIELACDEKVIKEMDWEQKADYSQALLTCSVNRRIIAACPLAFGEVSIKSRVKSVLNYKKPAFWIIVVAIVVTLVVGVCFLTNPASTELSTEMSAFIEEQILQHHRGMYKSGEFSCADFQVLGKANKKNRITVYMWVLYEEYTDDNGKIEDVSGAHIPTVITFVDHNGQYELVEYWEPRDGTYYPEDIRDIFPLYLWRKATDSQRYIEKQHQNCYKKACKYFIESFLPEDADMLENTEFLNDIDKLRAKYPMYFDLPTTNGLEVYIWQKNEHSYLCGLLPGHPNSYSQADIEKLYEFPARLKEMQKIVTYYIASGEVIKNDVVIMPVSKYFSYGTYYTFESHWQELTELFWAGVPNAQSITIETTLSYASWSEESTIVTGGLNRNKMDDGSIRHLPIYKFITLEELERFKNNHRLHHTMDQGYGEIPSFNDATAKYDKAFFENNCLLLIYVEANNSTHRFAVEHVGQSNGTFLVFVQETTGAEVVDTAMAGWFITLAVPDAQIKNCTDFDAWLNICIEEDWTDNKKPYYVISNPNCFRSEEYVQTPINKIDEFSKNEQFIYTQSHCKFAGELWYCQEYQYLYRLEITGRMNNAAKYTTYVILSNTKDITFEQAWKAAGFSSNSEDYFDPADAMIVGHRSFSIPTNEPAQTEPPATTPDNNNSSNYKLIVAGRDITQGNYIKVSNVTDNSCDIYLPFTAVAKCYGIKVNWTSNTVAEITFNGNTYLLDLSNVSLVKEGGNSNYLIPAPGSSMYAQAMGKELILDHVTLRSVLMFMGINAQVRIDHQSKTVTIQ